jgi:broad specificity phosphatase PhoE
MDKLYEKNSNGNILYIRHGETYYNKGEPSGLEANTNPDYLDCPLNETGKQQAEAVQQSLNKLKLKYVFSSPLMRCLETTYIALKTHPQRDSIVVIVHPLITEIVNCTHDFNVSFEDKKKLFNMESEVKFDWSYFESVYPEPKYREVYFLDYVDNVRPEDQAAYDEVKAELLEGNSKDKLIKLVKVLHNKKGQRRFESIKSVFNRGLKFKQYLRDLLKDVQLEGDEKVLVFTHSTFIMVTNSEKAKSISYEDCQYPEYPDDCYKPKNLEILSINIYK